MSQGYILGYKELMSTLKGLNIILLDAIVKQQATQMYQRSA